MPTSSPVASWKEVRNEELSEVITRRLAVRQLSPKVMAGLLKSWVHDGMLPTGEGWTTEKLARTWEEWLDGRALVPRALVSTVARWASAGLLPGAASLREEECRAALQRPILASIVQLLDGRDLVRELRDFDANLLREYAVQWTQAGWLPAGRQPTAEELAQGIEALRSGSSHTLERPLVEDLEGKVKARKAEKLAAALCEAGGKLQLLLADVAARQLGDRKERTDDQEILAFEAATDWRWEGSHTDTGQEILILAALSLEALMRCHCSGDLVGLALSGGGIRSASFNLGLLQALLGHRLLRDVDYLSTVSGGGYVGSLLSSLIHRRDVHLDPRHKKEPPLAPAPNGKQPDRVTTLVRSGSYLNRPYLHASRYLTGLVLNNLVLLSLMIASCALAAWLWRGVLDQYPRAEWLMWMSGGWIREWNRPFLPAVAVLLLWFVASAGNLVVSRRPPPYWITGLLLLAGLFFLIGAAVWLATPSVFFPFLAPKSPDTEMPRIALDNYPFLILLVLAVFGLLPFLRPRRFVASGTRPASGKFERMAFRVLSLALLGGVPFFILYLIARHGVAADFTAAYMAQPATEDRGRVDNPRRAGLHPTDIYHARWKGFWTRVQAQNDQLTGSVGSHIWTRMAPVHAEIGATCGEDAPGIPEAERLEPIRDLPQPLPRHTKARDTKERILKTLNDRVIQDPQFAKAVLAGPAHEIREANRAILLSRADDMKEGARLRSLMERFDQGRLIPEKDYPELNRLILEAYHRGAIWERAVVRRPVVIDGDQAFRLSLLLTVLAVAGVASLFVGLNTTSLHGIYRSQLSRVYLEPPGEVARDIPLHELDTTTKGGPYHLLSGALNTDGVDRNNPRPTAHFLFSPRFCGSMLTGFAPTQDYQDGSLDLGTAMAISGAAFTPARVQNRFVAFIMLILNVRLGQWLPSPRFPSRVRWLPMVRLAASLLWHRGTQQRRYWFVSDGGHSENLGLGPLLRRECQLIILSDAGYDPDYGFDDFVQLYRHARLKGVRFTTLEQDQLMRVDPLVPQGRARTSRHRYVIARIEYPGPEKKWGLLIYLKPSFVGDEALDLMRYRATNSEFPHDPTANQWFDTDQVESYRELGAWIGKTACRALEDMFSRRREGTKALQQIVSELAAKARPKDTGMENQENDHSRMSGQKDAETGSLPA